MMQEAKKLERKRGKLFNRRKHPLLRGFFYIAIGAGIALILHFYGAIFGMEEKDTNGIGALILIVFCCVGTCSMMPWKRTADRYDRLYRSTVLPKLMPEGIDITACDVNHGFQECDLKFIPIPYDTFISDFLLTGTYAGARFEYGRICLQDQNRAYSATSEKYHSSYSTDLLAGMLLKMRASVKVDFMLVSRSNNFSIKAYDWVGYVSGDSEFDSQFSCIVSDEASMSSILTENVRAEIKKAAKVSNASLFICQYDGFLWLMYNDQDSEAVIPEDTKITEEYLASFTQKAQALFEVAKQFLHN